MYWWHQVVLYDCSFVSGVWNYLIRSPESEINSLPLLGYDQNVDDLPASLLPEARDLIGLWCHRGIAHVARRSSTWRRSGRYDGHFWSSIARARVSNQLKYIRHWRVGRLDYRQAIPLKATWFVDAPYCGRKGTRYPASSSGIDYSELAAWCLNRKGQLIVCEADQAEWLPFETIRTVRGVGVSKYAELVYAAQSL